jgi:hypothetical protein
MTIKVEYIPRLFVKGVAPNGREYRLDGVFGHWLQSVTKEESLSLWETSIINQQQVKDLWAIAARSDKPPKQLKIFLQRNPKFGIFIRMATVWNFANHKLSPKGFTEQQVDVSLRAALGSGKIRTRGIEGDKKGNWITYTNIEFRTKDVIKWLELEHEIKTSLDELLDWEDDSTEFAQALNQCK